MEQNILPFETVDIDDENSALVIVDQTKLPEVVEILSLTKQEEIWDAIFHLKVRGAPAIGVAAAIAYYLAAKGINIEDLEEFYKELDKAREYLASSRPTAVNLFWALERMDKCARNHSSVSLIKEALLLEAIKIRDEDIEVCKNIGLNGLKLIQEGNGILTHCNAGQLATVRYGTATAPIYQAFMNGVNFKVFVDETRPLLQGARLTAYELTSAGVDATLICDNMVSSLMKKGSINAVFVGCDRVAANGDAANKIGTSGVAILAKYYNVPFYICAPTSTIDMKCLTGNDIPVEERAGEEITEMWYENRMAPKDIKTYNPAFDVTDNSLITGIITEYGILYPPYSKSLKKIMEEGR